MLKTFAKSATLYKYVILVLVICFIGVACEIDQGLPEWQTELEPPDPNLRADVLLFTPDDFPHWNGPYNSVPMPSIYAGKENEIESGFLVSMFTFEPNRYKNGDINDSRSASQSVEIYTNAEGAYADYKVMEDFFDGSRGIYEYVENFHPKVENITGRCGEAYTPEYGDYLKCTVLFQSGKIIVQGDMYVDNEVFTLDDWALFVNVLQDKFVAYQSP